MASFNFNELVARAFYDYVGPVFPQWWATNKTKLVLPALNTINREQLLGKKHFMTLKFGYKGKEFVLPFEPLVALSKAKTIVKTATVGKDRIGTVKEYITTEDYVISIRGVCINENDLDSYPGEQVKVLNDLFNINDAIDVKDNLFFELFGIRKIVLEDMKIDDMVGENGAQRFQFSAISDQDFYADVNDRNKFLG